MSFHVSRLTSDGSSLRQTVKGHLELRKALRIRLRIGVRVVPLCRLIVGPFELRFGCARPDAKQSSVELYRLRIVTTTAAISCPPSRLLSRSKATRLRSPMILFGCPTASRVLAKPLVLPTRLTARPVHARAIIAARSRRAHVLVPAGRTRAEATACARIEATPFGATPHRFLRYSHARTVYMPKHLSAKLPYHLELESETDSADGNEDEAGASHGRRVEVAATPLVGLLDLLRPDARNHQEGCTRRAGSRPCFRRQSARRRAPPWCQVKSSQVTSPEILHPASRTEFQVM